MAKLTTHIYILGTILFTVYGQLVMKWRIGKFAPLPEPFYAKVQTLLKAVFDPYIFSGYLAAFLASLCWMAAMTKFELSYAYPYMALNFVLVFLLSFWLFQENINSYKIIGLLLIVLGVIISARSLS